MQTAISDASSNSPQYTVIGVLGKPGSGKSTQCELLAKTFKLAHISVGDALREEMKREDSPYEASIKQNICAGTISPEESTIPILNAHIQAAMGDGIDLFVLDGFPRTQKQAEYFTNINIPIKFVIKLECPDDIVATRLSQRMRPDDNPEDIDKRLCTFHKTTSLVIDWLSSQKEMVKTLDAEGSIEAINKRFVEAIVTKERDFPGTELVKRPTETIDVPDNGQRHD
ncbi:adenylate kinase-domain-containing protein [Nemania sp. FL0031]|nr:adenylate kinase-domain-containing protein [Nemania sp. FL0031]